MALEDEPLSYAGSGPRAAAGIDALINRIENIYFGFRNPCSSLVPVSDRVLAAAGEGDDRARSLAVRLCSAS